MKIKHIYMAAAVFAAATLAGCEDEKDLVIIDGNLPIKASALYMVGDATPNGWSIDSPTPFTATESDPLVFEWSGSLNAGEMKLCLVPGSWDAPFIRPLEDQCPIGTSDIDNASFQMHAGDPDQKWRVTDAGSYTLTFDLRNWKMSTRYNGGAPEPSKDPISTETLYLVGDATPAGWSIESPTPLEKTGDYTFVYEGELKTGEMKACLVAGSWDVDFVRPASADVEINKDGVAADDFVFTAGPDNKWKVTYRANYRVTFNLAEYTVAVEYLSDVEGGDENPLLSASDVWMIGDATPNGWSLDDAQHFEKADGKDHVFVWQGQLVGGTFKACIIRDFSAPFIRPASGGVTVS
ncbi:MAG: SusF/SusE family outer membrane protein, partial [Muribaculaceae bacterium]|nr:SusF/SusE family outer membrane protein [Muribaculaceae bacterium]